jgi:signal transduction histidine kinase
VGPGDGVRVTDVLEDLATALEGAKLEVGTLPTVTGDPVQLRAVLQNLVANAAKFTRPGDRAAIAISSRRTRGGWRVEVSDHGPGIAPGERERVFQPLARVDEDVEGSGIGLTTCRRVIDAHGGRVGLAESPGGGTTAWFELPG